MCVMVLDESLGFSPALYFLQSLVWLLRGLGLEVCLQCKLKWSGKLSLPSLKECLDMRYVRNQCKIILFFLFFLNNMIYELFPMACLSDHNIPFIVLNLFLFFSFLFTCNIPLYIHMHFCKDFFLSIIISWNDPQHFGAPTANQRD